MTTEALNTTEETKHTKYNFVSSDQPIGSIDELDRRLRGYRAVPDNVRFVGTPGETGIAIVYNGTIHGAVKHPDFNPKSIDFATGKAEFGKPQDFGQIETSMAVPIGEKDAQLVASYLIRHIKEDGLSSVTEETGFGTLGPEEEALHYHANGTPYELPAKEQIEVQYNVKETPIKPPSKNIWDHARRYAQHRVDEQDKDPERLIVNTSFSILGRPDEQHMTSGEYKAYVHAVCAKMVKDNFFPRDKVVLNFWDKLAQNAGYVDFYDLKEKVGNLSPLSFTASHISLGLRSERRDGSYKIGLEEGIAVSDMANSNFGTLLEWMTYSTPLAYENRVGVDVGGEIKYPKDVRAVARHASKTTYPGDFIYSTKNYRDRVVEAVVNGYADRLDRAGYVSVDPETGEKVGSAHGRVRLRVTGGSGKDPFTDRLGRVELTGGSSTPDLVALTARNAMFTLMSVAAYEAVANGSHPVDYFRDKFPNISECDRHIELAHAYNFDGADDPKVSALLAEGKAFLDYMRANYTHPDMKYLADLSELGLNKLFEKTRARNLDEYLNDPRGNISDVITNMYIDGYKPLEIARKIKEFEYKQSKNILNFDGDVLAMELSKRNRH